MRLLVKPMLLALLAGAILGAASKAVADPNPPARYGIGTAVRFVQTSHRAARCVHTRRDAYPLHRGSRGCRVRDLQYLLAGGTLSHFRKAHPYRGHRIDGVYGPATARAVRSIKWRLGYPYAHVSGRVAGRFLYSILSGKGGAKRPLPWIARAAKRVKQVRAGHKYPTTSCQRRMVAVARSQLGQTEHPFGSNFGWPVSSYLAAAGVRYPAPWCASFAAWVLVHAGARSPILSASVGSFRWYGYRRGWLHSVARTGSLAIFGTEHMGIVESVGQHSYVSIEGNYSNSVRRVYHRIGDRPTVFEWIPWCT